VPDRQGGSLYMISEAPLKKKKEKKEKKERR